MASSQAGEEPTTDDELINEVILSPLFSKKSIEVALESAHLDFDSASQQECQDILDSLEPVTGAEELNASTSMLDDSTSLSNTIPQIDGSSDENQKVPQGHDQCKITRKKIGSPSHSSSKNNSKLSSTRGGTELLWGSLPLSTKKRPHGNSDGPVTTSSGSRMPTEKQPSSCKSKTEKNSHDTTDDTDKESSSLIGEHGSACQSVRDLMRRRRRRGSFQPEQLDFGSSGAAACTMGKESELVISGGSELHDFTSDLYNSEKAYSGDHYVQMTFARKPPLQNEVCSGLEGSSVSIEQPECKFGKKLSCNFTFTDADMLSGCIF
jgi:DNA polymerase zeta